MIFLIIYGLVLFLWLYAFFSTLTNQFKNGNDKVVWILLLIFLPATAILFPFIGKRQITKKQNSENNNIVNESQQIKKDEIIKKQHIKENKEYKQKSKILAVILNILSIGMGYLYVGHIKKALLFSILFPIFIYTQFYIATIYVNIFTVLLNYTLIVLIYIYAIYDVLNIISKKQDKFIKLNKWYFMILFYIVYIIYIISIKQFIPIKLLKQPSNSMANTIIIGDTIIVKNNNYIPNRGDIVVFKYPHNTKIYYVKRCVAKGGDIIAIINKDLYLKPNENNEFILNNYPKENIVKIQNQLWVKNPYQIYAKGIHNDISVSQQNSPYSQLFNMKPILIPENAYFMMGDNRDHSNDSRFWGTVPQKYIVGKVNFIYINFSDISRSGMKIK